jgi:hypothetical protein
VQLCTAFAHYLRLLRQPDAAARRDTACGPEPSPEEAEEPAALQAADSELDETIRPGHLSACFENINSPYLQATFPLATLSCASAGCSTMRGTKNKRTHLLIRRLPRESRAKAVGTARRIMSRGGSLASTVARVAFDWHFLGPLLACAKTSFHLERCRFGLNHWPP